MTDSSTVAIRTLDTGAIEVSVILPCDLDALPVDERRRIVEATFTRCADGVMARLARMGHRLFAVAERPVHSRGLRRMGRAG